MKSSIGRLMVLTAVAAALVASCTIMERVRQLSPGEVRLTKLEAPEMVEEGTSYQGTLKYRGEGLPTIRKVCCRWVAATPGVKNASMYWYNLEVAGDKTPGTEGTKWVDQGAVQDFSNTFCMSGSEARLVGSDAIVFSFTATKIKHTYNTMECYAETLLNGAVTESNRVAAPINRSY
ncbi:MAG: hypothetical protein AB9873_01800 [Syntrophobacteraceae bacterium]